MVRFLKAMGGLLLASALVACGGGGGSAGTTSTGGGSGSGSGSTTSPTVASFIYQLSKNTLNTSGTDASVLTVTALDSKNNPVSGASVTVSVDTGVYTPSSSTTDSSGQAGGSITIGANKTRRNITATITVGSQTTTAVVAVAGSTITLSPVPTTPSPGAPVRVDIKVADSTGAGVAGVPVQLGGTLGMTGTVTTDATGSATANLGAAPAAAGSYTIDATALGVTTTRSVQVVSTSGGGIPDATGPISSASLAIVPNTIAPNASGSTTNKASLKAKFLNGSNQAVQNVRVRFEIVQPGLGSGEQLSSGTATVFSDVNGEAISDYIAGTRSSPTNGVTIRACYALTDAGIANGGCPSSVTQTLTVASQPLSITLGDNNTLAKGNGGLTYIKQFDVAVADSAGNAVSGAVISASVDITHYGKGKFEYGSYQVTGTQAPDSSTTGISTSATPTALAGRVWCPNEDLNRNGFMDTGEDINNNGKIDPRKADVILSFVSGNTTGSGGRMTIQVEYPQNVATWLSYTVRVTTNVAGSEGTTAKSYLTTFLEGDLDNGSFRTAPYGENKCIDSN